MASVRRLGTAGFHLGRRLPGARAGAALAVGVVSSGTSFTLSLAIAQTASIEEFGQFVIAFGVHALWVGVTRATVTETVVLSGPGETTGVKGARRVALVGLLAAVVTGLAGLVVNSIFLVLLAPLLPGILLNDHKKVASLGTGRSATAVAQDALLAILTVAGAAIGVVFIDNPLFVFCVWGTAAASIGVVATSVRRCPALPGWDLSMAQTRQSLAFGGQFLVTSGSAHLALVALAATAGTAAVGALGAARTMLGPVTLIMNTMAIAVVSHLARGVTQPPGSRLRRATRLTLLAVVSAGLLATACTVAAERFGSRLLGDTWPQARPLVPVLAVESILALAATVALAGHRVERAGGRALLLGSLMGVVRVLALTTAGFSLHVRGCAGILVVLALLSALVWWGSYLVLLNDRAARSTNETIVSTSPAVRSG
jgi:hypothetical protein